MRYVPASRAAPARRQRKSHRRRPRKRRPRGRPPNGKRTDSRSCCEIRIRHGGPQVARIARGRQVLDFHRSRPEAVGKGHQSAAVAPSRAEAMGPRSQAGCLKLLAASACSANLTGARHQQATGLLTTTALGKSLRAFRRRGVRTAHFRDRASCRSAGITSSAEMSFSERADKYCR